MQLKDVYELMKLVLMDSIITKTKINYIRNSIKVLINAYDGTIKYFSKKDEGTKVVVTLPIEKIF